MSEEVKVCFECQLSAKSGKRVAVRWQTNMEQQQKMYVEASVCLWVCQTLVLNVSIIETLESMVRTTTQILLATTSLSNRGQVLKNLPYRY